MPRILIADDEAHVRTIVKMKLESAGFTIAVAIDGQEALELAAEFHPELVLTDLQMPRMTGLEFCIKLRSIPGLENIPAIMLTSRGDILNDEQRQQGGIVRLLDKPFSPRLVVALVQETLAGPASAAA